MAQFLKTKQLIEEAIKAGCTTWAEFQEFIKNKTKTN